MSLGMHHALAEEAKEMLREDDERRRKAQEQALAKRRLSRGDAPRPSTLSKGASPSPAAAPLAAKDPAEQSNPPATTPSSAPAESAATFAHRRKASEDSPGGMVEPKVVRPTAMSSVYGGKKLRLPGDLGTGDPRRLPGDLGPNDPRRAPSPVAMSKSQSPNGRRAMGSGESPARASRPRRASDGALLRPKKKRESSDKAMRLATDKGSESSSDSDFAGGESDDEEPRGRDRVSRNNSVVEDSSSESETDGRLNKDPKPASTPNPPYSPSITVTPPSASSEHNPKKRPIHPHSAYDHSTPRHSDDEEHLSDLRRAQKLALTISPIHSTPSAHRVIRQIIRGDYAHFQREAEAGKRRQRVYLVATDLSPEAEYALEWTIGTVLRDGDTLLALYAVDEEGGTGVTEGVEIGHGADVVKDTARIVGNLPGERVPQSPAPSPLGKLNEIRSTSGSRARKDEARGRAERERYKAAEDISNRVVKLLRKTRLQIRCVVEVFHCKSPRHMITEVIDFLSPTMTILGSRGRSALKGVLLGSFSNYIVTKSSVPVMVARRRLRMHAKQKLHKDGLPVAGSSDGRMRLGRMSNVLEAPGTPGKRYDRLAIAKVD